MGMDTTAGNEGQAWHRGRDRIAGPNMPKGEEEAG
jgi:hypothetical protein